MTSDATTISCGIYVVRRRQLIELLERCAAEDRYDFVKDILQIFPAFLEKIVSFSFSHHAGERIFAMEAETFPAFVKKPLES